VRINCWHEVGRKNAPKDSLRCPGTDAKELRAAIRDARAGGAGPPDERLFERDRGFSARARMIARLLVGVPTVVLIVALVGAVFAPALLLAAAAAALVGGVTFALALDADRSVVVRADGVLRTEGWDGVREVQLRNYPRVTVQERKPLDLGSAPLE